MVKVKLLLIPVNRDIELTVDDREESVGRRIREGSQQKLDDYLVVIGEKEIEYLVSIGRKL